MVSVIGQVMGKKTVFAVSSWKKYWIHADLKGGRRQTPNIFFICFQKGLLIKNPFPAIFTSLHLNK